MICPIMADLWSMDGRGAGREAEVQNRRWKGMGGERREGVLCGQHSRHVCEYTALTPLPSPPPYIEHVSTIMHHISVAVHCCGDVWC